MAVPIKQFRITEVKQPSIGEVKPSSVVAEVTYSISSYRAHIRSEWDALKEHDVLFLLSIRPSFEPLSQEEAAKSSVPQRLGLQYVRGCEVIEMRDEEGVLMNDFTGRIKRDEWKPPKGELRTVTVALDTAQYHMDVADIAEKGAEDVYGTFNILMRRKPKENNFKAILDSIRDLMNESYGSDDLHLSPPFRIRLPKTMKSSTHALPGNEKISNITTSNGDEMAQYGSEKEKIFVEAYVPPDPGPYPQDQPKQNSIGAIISGIQPGLTMVVGPPGEQELATDLDFSRQGRVNAMLVRRLELLGEVERFARSLQLPEDVGYTCETAGYFWLLHVYSRWEQFLAACAQNKDKPSFIKDRFPFMEFFSNTPQPVFTGESFEKDMRAAKGCFRHLSTMFQELEECRAFELLKSTADRANYLMTKQAKIVAMTCTHAALKRKDFLQLGFKYDNLLMEESAQILEIETFIPMLLQRQEDGYARLKRCILIGDHHQLPPVVKNMAFQKYSHMDQSLFTRFVRLGVPYIELNAQGRARPSIAELYNWRYRNLGDLPYVREEVATVDKFQGQQNDFILLSLVRTRFVGHLRDVRRLVVAMSRARLGLYVFCRRALFEQCYELQPTFQLLLQRPDKLGLNLEETSPFTERLVGETGRIQFIGGVEEMDGLVNFRMHQLYQAQLISQYGAHQESVPGANGPQDSTSENQSEDTDMPTANGDANDGTFENNTAGEDQME
ncbi:hypothetical protein GW17_00003381 [Ensete ventricosum]|nr:hypothetical protein GW17_00003381 [Ensete ventricosum]